MTSGIQLRWERKKTIIEADKDLAEFVCRETGFWKKKIWGHSGDKVAEGGWVSKFPGRNTFWVWPRVTESLSPFQTKSDSHRGGSILANSSCTQSSNYYNLAAATTVAAQKTHYYSRALRNILHIQQTWQILPLHWLCETERSPPLSCIVSLITSLAEGHLTNMKEIKTTFLHLSGNVS